MVWRALRRNPVFTTTAVLLLAIGIAGTTVIFSVTDAVLLRPLAAARPGEMARVVELIPGRSPYAGFGWDDFQEFRQRTRSFRRVFGHAERDVVVDEAEQARHVRGYFVSPEYFDVLGVRA